MIASRQLSRKAFGWLFQREAGQIVPPEPPPNEIGHFIPDFNE
jgi:hypothetical protein